MATTTDPAAKLLKFVKAYRAGQKKFHTGVNSEIWAHMFKCDKSDTVTIYLKLAEILQLADEVERFIKDKPELPDDKFLSGFPTMRQGFTPRSLDEGVAGANQYFDNGLEVQLDFCSMVMRKETVIEQATLDELKVTIDELFESILAAELKPFLREALLDLVGLMRRAIQEYDIRGVKALKLAFGQMLAEVAVIHSEYDKDKDAGWRVALDKVAQKLLKTIETGANMATLLEYKPFAALISSLPIL